jgi:hypothetical protein
MVRTMLTLVLAFLMGFPAFGWGGDGFLLPGRGRRVAARCADGTCAFAHAPRRQAAVASHGCYGSTSYGYGSYGSTSYGSAGQTSYGQPEGKPSTSVNEFQDALTEVDKTEYDFFQRELMLVSQTDGELLASR